MFVVEREKRLFCPRQLRMVLCASLIVAERPDGSNNAGSENSLEEWRLCSQCIGLLPVAGTFASPLAAFPCASRPSPTPGQRTKSRYSGRAETSFHRIGAGLSISGPPIRPGDRRTVV
jgi:hypothetical protein